MECIAKPHCRHQPLHLSLNPHRPSFPIPISSLSFKTSPSSSSASFSSSTSSPPLKLSSIRASSSSLPPSSCDPLYQTPNHPIVQAVNAFIKTSSIAVTAAAALFFLRFHTKPSIAAPVARSATVEPTVESKVKISFEDQEKNLEEHLSRNPDDMEALRSLVEVRIKSRKLLQAIEVIDRLIELEPNEQEWPLLKSQVYSHHGDYESARKGFEELLQKDPLRVEAYHGLVMANSESGDSLNDVLKRIEIAMDKCKKEKKNSDLRDFKLLVAQIRVMEEKYVDALKVYEDLVEEEPRDFRPYLCQGIIYTLLRKKDEAEKKFEQFKKLVPKNHPYREYLVDDMFATIFLSEKAERGRAA